MSVAPNLYVAAVVLTFIFHSVNCARLTEVIEPNIEYDFIYGTLQENSVLLHTYARNQILYNSFKRIIHKKNHLSDTIHAVPKFQVAMPSIPYSGTRAAKFTMYLQVNKVATEQVVQSLATTLATTM